MREPKATAMDILNTDILILGSGLAGLRAALAAAEEDPSLDITVLSAAPGPCGSSFANRNNALGMQVCSSESDREIFAREAISLAAPGKIDPRLVDILTEESLPRFQDLCDLGIRFQRNGDGALSLHPGCFSPDHRRAVVFTNLAQAFERFHNRLQGKVRFLPGWHTRQLLTVQETTPRACGALLANPADPGANMAVRSKATVMALGGPAPLYPWHQAGPGNPGYSPALLHRAGVHLVNLGFLQMMWAAVEDQGFWSFSRFQPGLLLRTVHGRVIAPEEHLFEHLRKRTTHCPAAYGLADSALDQFLLHHLDDSGCVEIFEPVHGWRKIAPMAHAGNGGAWINEQSQTNLRSLYACGECAAGMHGANRIGGAMITATQVFGRRAGLYAAREARGSGLVPSKSFTQSIKDGPQLANTIQAAEKCSLNELTAALQQSPLSLETQLLNQTKYAVKEKISEHLGESRLKLESLHLIMEDRLKYLLN